MAKSRKSKTAKKEPAAVPVPAVEDHRTRIDRDTKDNIVTAADELAAKAGYVFDGERGVYVCEWMERNCYLYEGPGAGEPIVLIPYQRSFVMRLFSWVRKSDTYNQWVRRFNWANLLCAKKNGKTPFMAAVGLYLTVADGEPGNKVFMSAINGKQAARAQEHAIQMVEKSPNLCEPVCTINKSTLQIMHNATKSRLLVLSGENSRGAKANEGINGSVIIDELHVFDREMAERVGRAGRSRKEPLNFAVSTAGDDPSSYGYERVQYGRDVNEGKKKDPHFLHVEYAAPQKATNTEISEHIEEYVRAANPALETTGAPILKLDELIEDWERSRDNPREAARCKQYTLNIHVGSTFPWLNAANWEKCRRVLPMEELRERECYLGIDLARTKDMTCGVFVFPMNEVSDECAHVVPHFFMPRATAELRKNLFPFLEWEEAGHLTLTEGNVTDYTVVENDLVAFAEAHSLLVTDIFFDAYRAEELTQRLAERLNCNRTSVSQAIMTISPLAMELERRIDGGLITHQGNAVLDWQVGHVQIHPDNNRNIRPVKPDPNTGKCIDGIMATINTFVGLMGLEGADSGPSLSFF